MTNEQRLKLIEEALGRGTQEAEVRSAHEVWIADNSAAANPAMVFSAQEYTVESEGKVYLVENCGDLRRFRNPQH